MNSQFELHLTGDDSDHEAIKGACIALLPAWHGLTSDNLSVTAISGGISNLLVKVEVTNGSISLPPVALKAFGPRTELLVDREREVRTLQRLNAAGFGAKVLVSFANGRIEEFLVARTLSPTEMCSSDYIPRIARTIKRFHSIISDDQVKRGPSLWETIFSWFEMARCLSFEDPVKQEAYSKFDFSSMWREIREIKSICDAVPSPIVFSHNDLLSGNFLVIESDSSMQLIDFEYSDLGYRGFDLGNHFNEYAGFECDYSRYPSSEAQHLFFKHYVSLEGSDTLILPDVLLDMEAEVNVFSLTSHIYWGVWAIIQARWSPIDFDYLTYSQTRWKEYHNRKVEFVSKARERFRSIPSQPFVVIAHRGNSAECPELTFDAFDSALELTSDFELDVQLTSDSVVIVLHDEELGRTNNGRNGQAVAETQHSEVSLLDAGSWFNHNFSHCRIPTLASLLERYHHRAHIHTELKSKQPGLPKAVSDVLTSSGWTELSLITITSFHLDQLKASLSLLPQVAHGWLVQTLDKSIFNQAREAGITELCPRIDAVDKRMVDEAKALGFSVRGWGIKNEDLLIKARDVGCYGATVDWPRIGLKILRQS